tara:strand:+ start:200137 stop:201120 length:984 start_codon:yes stop_codon:yes gene_type:complete
MRILVCGGAGYIGSHLVKSAYEMGHDLIVLDNLSTGHAKAVMSATLVQGDINNFAWLKNLLQQNPCDLVMHFCAHSLVGESIIDPAKYYENNVSSTLTLLKAMQQTGHNKLVFSSSAAVYGNPEQTALAEDHPLKPINPYGRSKLMVEHILQDYAAAYGLDVVSLRYFNAAGADPSGLIGEKHDPETHLIPNVLNSVAHANKHRLKVFGVDYQTPDGSCVRDYIHVNDLASAHLAAAHFLEQQAGFHVFNLGNGHGFSVLDIITAAERVTGKTIAYDVCNRRPGDPPVLIANASAARKILGWKPHYTRIEDIIETAWCWHTNSMQFI